MHDLWVHDLILFLMTCRLYIDEVGNGDLLGAAHDPNVRYLSLTGLIMKVRAHDSRLQPALEKLKAEYVGDNGGKPVILHRREIVRREGPFAVLRNDEKREGFNRTLLEIIDDQPFLVMTVVIDKKEHLDRYQAWRFDPYHYCLQCLVERYVNWLRRNDLTGDVIIEARFKKADKKLKASFLRLWERGTGTIAPAVVQKHLQSREIGLIPKVANVAGLQICDLIAHPSAREMRRERDGLDPYADFGAEIVRLLREKKYARNPRTMAIEGWGTKWLP